jgi:hypothetical protein
MRSRFIIRSVCAMSALLITGCQQIAGTQMALLDQARKGVALSQQYAAEQEKLADELARVHNLRLGEALDADLKSAGELTPEKIIAARKAYAIGLEAIARQRQSWREAADLNRRNLAAADRALQQAKSLVESQLKLVTVLENP